ncbi:response regulator [Carboxydothermus ferrireducens]|uniref:Response regulator of citrate/malate metabolism n=1 Tax=Carboxydothermus ferrireducens DSM 11255 TaxID=1119529 RepID=A0ABX2RB32_9THEO|nr:hypothetical protein [Carboxydothermus ferrireducens]NYE58134.1 response regulator of citrate/malate metabolism [Carboxydothermus ferrireducens DSM 11255]
MIKTVIVEDDPMVLEINKNFIKEVEGFEIIAALKSGSELLNFLKTTLQNFSSWIFTFPILTV